MAKRFTGIGVAAVLSVIGGLAALGACNSSDVTGDCTTLPSCCTQLTDSSLKAECDSVVSAGDPTDCGEAQDDFAGDALCVVSSGGGSTSATGCAGLTTCCTSLEAAEQPSCQEIVSLGMDSTCTEELTSLQGAGMCKSSVTVDAGSGGTGCTGLTSCCASLTGAEQTACEEIAGEGIASSCTEALTVYGCGGTTTTDAGTGGTGCAGLTSCCASLTGEEQTACDEEVTASNGNDTMCTDYLTSLQDEDMCGGGTITTDAGTGGTDCATLSACCSTVPAADQATCEEAASAGNETTCAEYVETFDCGGTSTTDAGTGGTNCASLSSCCATLTGEEQTACDEEVSAAAGNDTTCGEYMTDLEDSGYCG